ncbi:hypothetical protein BKH45_08340 [Helicobacter sp. 11S03491-1]|nr:hypothetical protein BKH45_08340 [Helicobacter sp. 11S03491-1]
MESFIKIFLDLEILNILLFILLFIGIINLVLMAGVFYLENRSCFSFKINLLMSIYLFLFICFYPAYIFYILNNLSWSRTLHFPIVFGMISILIFFMIFLFTILKKRSLSFNDKIFLITTSFSCPVLFFMIFNLFYKLDSGVFYFLMMLGIGFFYIYTFLSILNIILQTTKFIQFLRRRKRDR